MKDTDRCQYSHLAHPDLPATQRTKRGNDQAFWATNGVPGNLNDNADA
jgi:hypothetical protein